MLQNSPLYAYIPAKDVARARQFYERKLGLKPKQETEGGVVYEFGDKTGCFLYPTPNASASLTIASFTTFGICASGPAKPARRSSQLPTSGLLRMLPTRSFSTSVVPCAVRTTSAASWSRVPGTVTNCTFGSPKSGT